MTDDTREQALRQFFQERIVPSAGALRERGISFFALAPGRTQGSYWSERSRGEEYIFQIGDDVASELRAMWRAYPELQALADDLAAMARGMGERHEEPTDVSSFIYAMF